MQKTAGFNYENERDFKLAENKLILGPVPVPGLVSRWT